MYLHLFYYTVYKKTMKNNNFHVHNIELGYKSGYKQNDASKQLRAIIFVQNVNNIAFWEGCIAHLRFYYDLMDEVLKPPIVWCVASVDRLLTPYPIGCFTELTGYLNGSDSGERKMDFTSYI